MQISLPRDTDGRVARECPSDSCSPGYFKVKLGTGITEGQQAAFCPYCRHSSEPSDFTTQEQIRYAKDLVLKEAHEGIERMFKGALGIGPSGKRKMGSDFFSIEMSYKPGPKSYVRRPLEEEVRRDIVCQHCGLEHSVYGLATWCSDCGKDIFLTHVEAELAVIRMMLSDIDRRRENFGARIAAKDLENCLEDTVSIFETILRIFVRRYLTVSGTPVEDIDQFFKKIGNAFQNLRRAQEIFLNNVQISLCDSLADDEIERLASTFEKRHPITHNLGVIDKKYIERARTAEKEGREVLVTADEIEEAIALSLKLFQSVHRQLFQQE